MTNERAIELLRRLQDEQFDGIHGDERREALEMAVRALEGDGDTISRQATIDARRYTFGNDEFSLEAAYHDCKLVFDGITDDDSFQEADTGLILYYANEIIYALQEALEGKDTKVPTNDCISRKMAIDAFEPEHDTDWYTPQIIEVLEALPPVQQTQTNADSTHENTLDCVSRQAAMIVIENSGLDDDSKDTVVRVLEQLPSAQPDYKTDHGYMWLCPHCGLPVHSDFEECLRCGTKRQSAQPKRENQKTALSVQVKVDFDDMKVLLEDIGKLQTYKLFVCDDMVLVDVEDIKDILAKHVKAKEVQSQRNTGKWITEVKHYKDESQDFYYERTCCSVCGAKKRIGWYDAKFCPSCGADMRGGDAECRTE